MSDVKRHHNRDAKPFASDWLSLREAADARARSSALTARLKDWLPPRSHRPLAIIDLGCGTGSNLRYLAPRLPFSQRWRLLDNDPELLARVTPPDDPPNAPLEWRCHQEDLARWLRAPDSMHDALKDCDLVSGTALLDLFSANWLETLAEGCVDAGAAVLMTLSVDGDWRFVSDGPDDLVVHDARVLALFRDHQRRDKGLGPALGGEAPTFLARCLERRGYRVELAASPWRLATEAGDEALGIALIDGWYQAAVEQAAVEQAAMEQAAMEQAASISSRSTSAWLKDWWLWRRMQFREGLVTLEVGHLDLLALPGERS